VVSLTLVRTSTKPPKIRFFFRKIYFPTQKNSISLYGQLDDVRTCKISEIEMTIQAREREKSTIVLYYSALLEPILSGTTEPPRRLLVQSRTPQKSFVFLLEEKIGRA